MSMNLKGSYEYCGKLLEQLHGEENIGGAHRNNEQSSFVGT